MISMYAKLKIWFVVILIAVLLVGYLMLNIRVSKLEGKLQAIERITSLEMYESIEKFSDSFKVPRYIAYNVAYQETGYRGPLHLNYDHKKTSFAGAVGPMQIIPRYAHHFAGRRVTEKELRENVQLNVYLSMKMLRYWYNIHRDWTLACGAYNSGKPIRNDYALYAAANKDYKNKWIKSVE